MMTNKPEPWFELSSDGDEVKLKTCIPLSSDPEGEPGFTVVRVSRLKAFHLAISILNVIEREMRNSANIAVPGVVVDRIAPEKAQVCSCGARKWCVP